MASCSKKPSKLRESEGVPQQQAPPPSQAQLPQESSAEPTSSSTAAAIPPSSTNQTDAKDTAGLALAGNTPDESSS